MICNRIPYSLEGKTFEEIGELLRSLSSEKDGVGLRVRLTEGEQNVFAEHTGMAIGHTLCQLLQEAVNNAGGNPHGFNFLYADGQFSTTASRPTA